MKYKQMYFNPVLTGMVTMVVLLSLTVYAAYGANPKVTNVQAAQRTDGSMKVDISYDLSDEDGDTVTISVNVSDDGGLTYDILPASITGNTGPGVTPGDGKSVVWDAGKDVPGVYGTEYVVKIIADDGKGDESTIGYKSSTVLGKALKYGAFSGKNSSFNGASIGGKSHGPSIVGSLVKKITKSLDSILETRSKRISTGVTMQSEHPYGTPYEYGTPYTYGTPYSSTPYPYGTPYSGTPYPYGTPYYYGTPYPYGTPYATWYPTPAYTPAPGAGIEGFTYNGDGTYTKTEEEGAVTITLSFYRSDGSQIIADISEPSNYSSGGELYGEDVEDFLFQVDVEVNVTQGATTVTMNMSSEKNGITIGGCPEEVQMTGSGTFEFEGIGTGVADTITVTVRECGEDISGHADIVLTVDDEECETSHISHDFDENGCLGGPVTCNGEQIGEMTRESDGNLYYTDSITDEKTLIDESLFSRSDNFPDPDA